MKLTSPYLNVVTIIGGIFFYLVVILFGVDENVASFTTVNRLCQVLCYQSKTLLLNSLYYSIGSYLGIFNWFLSFLWSNVGQGFQGLLHFPECQTKKEGNSNAFSELW